jgi:GMP synthase (glutamine-hydrolysing)
MQHAAIVIVDFGSQYTQLIARRIREAGVLSQVVYPDADLEHIKAMNPKGIILSGGPLSAYGDDALHLAEQVLTLNIPILGICYGMQIIAHELGGEVVAGTQAEYGRTMINIDQQCKLFANIDASEITVWMSHGDCLSKIPEGFSHTASTHNNIIAAMSDEQRSIYAMQFHPEVTHSEFGTQILENFLFTICDCKADWQPMQIIEESIDTVRAQVGDNKVILALSGGVDSSVTAMLLHKAIGKHLTCVFVDTGLLRLNEGNDVMAMFSEHMDLNVIRVDAEQRFLDALAGVDEPEAKRKIIGNLFIDIFEEEANKLEGIQFLAQGTIYPDVIESAGAKYAKVIKSHHNVGGLPERMNLKLVEPLRNLFKDEVRKIGEAMGMKHEMVYRHPFPGPGLAVRILGEVKKEYADILRLADNIFIQALRAHDLYHKTAQAFVVFMPVKSVGVVGDNRQYGYVLAIRAVETSDFMTADFAHLPHEFLSEVSTRIINEIKDVARVVYDVSSKPPATIEWE